MNYNFIFLLFSLFAIPVSSNFTVLRSLLSSLYNRSIPENKKNLANFETRESNFVPFEKNFLRNSISSLLRNGYLKNNYESSSNSLNKKSTNNILKKDMVSRSNDDLVNVTVPTSNIEYEKTENPLLSTYTYLSNKTLPLLNSSFLGNTLDSIENILKKYKFLNLYSGSPINETKNDRDIIESSSNFVILKANFADYAGYNNTDKTTVLGSIPDQNFTDSKFGNNRLVKKHQLF